MNLTQNINELLIEFLNTADLAVDALNLNNKNDIKCMKFLLKSCADIMKVSTTISLNYKQRKTPKIVKEVKRLNNKRTQMTNAAFSRLIKELKTNEYSFLNSMNMNIKMFNIILNAIHGSIRRKNTIMKASISTAEKLLATLRFLATGESYKSLSEETKLSQAFLSHTIPEVCTAIWQNLENKYLRLPATAAEWQRIAFGFQKKFQFPHCLGALDGKHLHFKPSRKDVAFDCKNLRSYSIPLLFLVDSDCRFTYVNVDCQHENGILLQDSLQEVVDNISPNFPSDDYLGNVGKMPFVLIANNYFPLTQQILTPYIDNNANAPHDDDTAAALAEKQIFNMHIYWPLNLIEKTIEILEQRFKILTKKINLPTETVKLIFKTCCLLHNLTLTHNNEIVTLDEMDEIDMKKDTALIFATNYDPINNEAIAIRHGFTNYFIEESCYDWLDANVV